MFVVHLGSVDRRDAEGLSFVNRPVVLYEIKYKRYGCNGLPVELSITSTRSETSLVDLASDLTR